MRREGGVDWCGWYIHETGVTFDTSASPLTLEKFKRMLTPETAQNVDLDALAKLGPDLWDSANSVLVNSRVVLTNGTLAVTGFKPDVQSGGTTVAEVATVLTWTTTASEVRLSPLTGNTEQDLLVSLTKPTQVWVRNFSARPPHDPTQALHFPELFDFAAGAKPPWPERAIPKIAPGPNAQNSFCPPVVLGK
jgi:hypothetical protein